MRKKKDVVYSLDVTDLQTVAHQELERELTQAEIAKISISIAKNIHWYEIIAFSIYENIRATNH